MGLKAEAIWNRLKTVLAFQQKLVTENRDKEGMDRAARKIRRLIVLLENYDKKIGQHPGIAE